MARTGKRVCPHVMIMFRGDHHFSFLFQKLKSWTVPKIASCTCKEIPQMNFECRKENSLVEFHILPKWKPWPSAVAMRCQRPQNIYKTNTRSTISRKKNRENRPVHTCWRRRCGATSSEGKGQPREGQEKSGSETGRRGKRWARAGRYRHM